MASIDRETLWCGSHLNGKTAASNKTLSMAWYRGGGVSVCVRQELIEHSFSRKEVLSLCLLSVVGGVETAAVN